MTPAEPLMIAVTPGDPDGIGPEIVWKAIQSGIQEETSISMLCVGAREPFEKLGAKIIEAQIGSLVPPKNRKNSVWLLPAPTQSKRFLPGFQSGWSIETATRIVLRGQAQALVTGPISKERLQKGGYRFPGHTEFLAHLCKSKSVTMMLANDTLRISLVTTHVALKDVSRQLTRAALRRAVIHTAEHIENWWGISQPRIAVAALNPHAGEAGLFGKEEIRIIEPELKALRKQYGARFEILGPLPADTLFAKHVAASPQQRYDAVVCMYHDQGLIPVKLLDFPKTVNVSLGLPIVRTSVDHGVGFDIAGQGLADPSSLLSAIRLAIHIAKNRRG